LNNSLNHQRLETPVSLIFKSLISCIHK